MNKLETLKAGDKVRYIGDDYSFLPTNTEHEIINNDGEKLRIKDLDGMHLNIPYKDFELIEPSIGFKPGDWVTCVSDDYQEKLPVGSDWLVTRFHTSDRDYITLEVDGITDRYVRYASDYKLASDQRKQEPIATPAKPVVKLIHFKRL